MGQRACGARNGGRAIISRTAPIFTPKSSLLSRQRTENSCTDHPCGDAVRQRASVLRETFTGKSSFFAGSESDPSPEPGSNHHKIDD
jgi:hypothetical protein